MKPYYEDKLCTIYHADFRKVLRFVSSADLIIADPPYEETRFEWDRWPLNWPSRVLRAGHSNCSLWCFGSLRVLWEKAREFKQWQFVQDVVWEKQNGTGLHNDRFRRVHESVVHFRPIGSTWKEMYHVTPVTMDARKRNIKRQTKPGHWGQISSGVYRVDEGGARLVRSVMFHKNLHRKALHPTQKPLPLISHLVEYSCPENGLVFSPFMGSGTDLVAAKSLNRRSIGCDGDEEMCEIAARRCSQDFLNFTP